MSSKPNFGLLEGINAALDRLLKEHGPASDVARRAGVSSSSVSRWRREGAVIPSDGLGRLLEAMGVSLGELELLLSEINGRPLASPPADEDELPGEVIMGVFFLPERASNQGELFRQLQRFVLRYQQQRSSKSRQEKA